MTYFPLSQVQLAWHDRAQAIANDVLAPRAAEADRTATFPSEQLQVLRDEGFFGIRADREHGGQGEGLLTTCLVVETLAKACPSTGLIFKMHVESTEIVSRVPTADQAEKITPRIASGEWLSTVAGSEAGHQGGAWAGAPKAAVRAVEGGYEVDNVKKAFVTAAGIADTYLFMATLREEGKPPAALMFQILEDDLEWSIDEPWDGLGMRANVSSPMTFSGFLPEYRKLNPENKPVDFFSVAVGTYAATYLGIAGGCYDLLEKYVAETTLADGRRMPEVETIANRVARAKVELERSRALLYSACSAWDDGRVKGPQALFEAKVAADELATFITGEAMTLGGGTAFAKRLPFERYFRDARAGMVMGIAHDIAVLNIARSIFPKPKAPAT
ncbi:MAG: acyl-CoA/acyl-ACP dehydrogenase [Chloroflexi bacterium]|nr:acyl-CoA/acyl-ACP dehydrogenase [Chloroflexota bacterium]